MMEGYEKNWDSSDICGKVFPSFFGIFVDRIWQLSAILKPNNWQLVWKIRVFEAGAT